MKRSCSPVADEYNEDTDKANESEDDQWEENKLVIDLDLNSSMNSCENNRQTTGSKSKDMLSKSAEDSFTPPEPKTEKPKGRRGVQQRKNDKSDTKEAAKANSKPSKVDKPPPNKPGRKRKEKPTSNSTNNSDRHSPLSEGSPTEIDVDEGIAATATGKHTTKTNQSEGVVAMKDAQTDYDWRSVASVTEPEHLAPCEPGTQVCLEGIVWQETNNGVLIVNVTWRGKTYMGTLLDATKHDWSPPSCDSPTTELETRTPKGRSKRNRMPLSDTFKDINERKLRREIRKQSGTLPSPVPSKAENGRRRGKSIECETGEPASKRSRTTSRNNTAPTPTASPSALIECPEPNCGKKYKQMNGLRYHQKNAHQDTMSHVSDSLSETEKQELPPTPDESKRMKRKNKTESAKSIRATSDSKAVIEEPVIKALDNSDITPFTTSVITSTTTQISNSNPQSNVPVAAITPQVVKSTGTTDELTKCSKSQQQSQTSVPTATPPVNRSLPSTPKLYPKSPANSMAPISTITSQGVYSSSLKPIQPKPTVLGESSPNPTLTDLKDHKKLKRRRSASRDDLTNGTPSTLDSQKFNSYNTDLESKSPSQRSNAIVSRSLSFSENSEEGQATVKREMANVAKTVINDNMCPPPAVFPVATVNPQKNIPQPIGAEKDRIKSSSHATHSPVIKPVIDDKSRRELELIKYHEQEMKQREPDIIKQLGHYQQHLAGMGWPTGMHPELIQQMMAREKQKQSTSPRPPTIKVQTTSQCKELDMRMSNDRLQFLKENVDLKKHGSSPSHSVSNDMPRDYSLSGSQRANEELNKLLMMQHKRELPQNQPSASKPLPTLPKQPELKSEVPRIQSHSSPMPPPFAGAFMSNQLLQYPLSTNPIFAGRSALDLLHPATSVSMGLQCMPEPKDMERHMTSQHFSKTDHKIHELESMKNSKSPRPNLSQLQPMEKSKAAPRPTIPPNFPPFINSFVSGLLPPK